MQVVGALSSCSAKDLLLSDITGDKVICDLTATTVTTTAATVTSVRNGVSFYTEAESQTLVFRMSCAKLLLHKVLAFASFMRADVLRKKGPIN